MGALTEREIFDCLEENFRLAAEYAEQMATNPRRGPIYVKFRESLKLAEGACRQAAAWREDSRWLKTGMNLAEAHQKAGGWLRGIKVKNGPYITLAEGHKHPLFVKLAEVLRAGAEAAKLLRMRATGKLGMILPEVRKAEPRTQGRPMQVLLPPMGPRVSPGGIILPS